MSNVVDGPKPHRVPATQPFERLPQCGCDSGTGPTFAEQSKRIAELEALLLAGLALHGGEAHTDSEKEWRVAARKALNLARS